MNGEMLALGKVRSAIREIFEYGKIRKAELGEDNVFDFSLGNPSVPAPKRVSEVMMRLIEKSDPVALHGYTSAQGDASVREKIAEWIQKEFSTPADPNLIYMTCGAAASLTITIKALCGTDDEVIVLSPYFPEYKVFIENAGAKTVIVPTKNDSFTLDLKAIDGAVNKRTKAIIINSPNNPSGVVFPKDDLIKLGKLLEDKSNELSTKIYIIADEPYRKLVYGDIDVPYIPTIYKRTAVCYSFSKSISLPGERIGYIALSPIDEDAKDLFLAICGAGRSLGYVCAPSLLQLTVAECLDEVADLDVYKTNRDLLYDTLTEYGYSLTKPDGAFYLFMKSPLEDANEFCERAKEFDILLVPSDSFGTGGYVRISYCVKTDMIRRALPRFKALIDSIR